MDLFLFTAFGDNWEGDTDRLASLCPVIVVTSLQYIGTVLQVNRFTCKHVVVCGGVSCPQNSAIGLLRVGQSGTRPERRNIEDMETSDSTSESVSEYQLGAGMHGLCVPAKGGCARAGKRSAQRTRHHQTNT